MREEITLRPMTRDEYHDFFRRYQADPMMDPAPYRYQFTHVDKSYDYDQARKDWYPQFGIFLGHEAIGMLALKRIDRDKQRCEIGLMMVDDTYKNKGFGTQAMREGIRVAREEYGVRHLYADTMGCNKRMQHVLEKLGFQLIERICGIYHFGDRMEDKMDYLLEI